MPDVVDRPTRARRHPIGSVRLRLTLAVSLLFGIALSVASLAFVARVQGSLVDDVYAQDTEALQGYARQLQQAALQGELSPPGNRPGTQIQVLDDQGRIVASTPGASVTPFDPRLDPGRPPMRGPAVGPPPNGRPPLGPDGRPIDPEDRRPGPDGRGPGPEQPAITSTTVPADGRAPAVVASAPAAEPVAQASRPSTTIIANPVAGAGAVGRSRDLAVSVVPVVTPLGPVNLISATSLDGVRQSVDTLTQGLRVAIPLLVVAVALAAWFLIGRALRPVAQMTAQVEAITASTLHERVPQPATGDEIGHLAGTMNRMLERLEQSATRQRQFVSDASHELRTPVATIRTELEVALMHPESADWPTIAHNVLAEDERLELIVGDLLTLARFDEAPRLDASERHDVDLDDVVRAQARRTRRVPVDTSAVAPVRVAGRRDELERMVGHLLDNAARHASSAVRVSVEQAATTPAMVCLAIEDDGDGVPQDQRDTIFERFGRLEEGRSRDRGGAGLGLAVVRKIAERHGGRVLVTDAPMGGARFEVHLPQ